jgi:hypothetical protein
MKIVINIIRKQYFAVLFQKGCILLYFSKKVVFLFNLFQKGCVFVQPFSKKCVFLVQPFPKRLCFWFNLFQKGCVFGSTFSKKVVFLVQPFPKRLCFAVLLPKVLRQYYSTRVPHFYIQSI